MVVTVTMPLRVGSVNESTRTRMSLGSMSSTDDVRLVNSSQSSLSSPSARSPVPAAVTLSSYCFTLTPSAPPKRCTISMSPSRKGLYSTPFSVSRYMRPDAGS